MKSEHGRARWPVTGMATICLILSACSSTGRDPLSQGQVFAPGVDPQGASVRGAEVGHRLIAAGEYELAIDAFNRAAAERGVIDGEILAGLGAANLGLGRLNQAEDLLRRATATPDARPEDWNNYGVLMMETGRTQEAIGIFRTAFALSNGENIAIRDNLRLALANFENSASLSAKQDTNKYRLERQGSSEFVLRPQP